MASPARGGSADSSAGPYPTYAVEPLLRELRGMDEDPRLATAGVGAAFAASFPSMPDEEFLSPLTAVQWSRVAAAVQVPATDPMCPASQSGRRFFGWLTASAALESSGR